MNRTIPFTAALLMLAAPAYATSRHDPPRNNNQPSSTSSAQATSKASASAHANATARQRQTQTQRQSARATGGTAMAAGGAGGTAMAAGGAGGTASAAGGSAAGGSVVYSAPSTQTIRTAPDVAAPAIWSNNPCIISASGSVSVVGFGASIGAGIEDPDCTRRANAQILATLGQPDAAREVLCANREVREAFMRAGRPCAADAARVQPATRVASVSLPPQPSPSATPAWCIPAAGETQADRLMRQANCR